MSESRTVHDPFLGQTVEVSDNLVDRLRGRYAIGPTLPSGEPEFGWRQFETPPVQIEAADLIEAQARVVSAAIALERGGTLCGENWHALRQALRARRGNADE